MVQRPMHRRQNLYELHVFSRQLAHLIFLCLLEYCASSQSFFPLTRVCQLKVCPLPRFTVFILSFTQGWCLLRCASSEFFCLLTLLVCQVPIFWAAYLSVSGEGVCQLTGKTCSPKHILCDPRFLINHGGGNLCS